MPLVDATWRTLAGLLCAAALFGPATAPAQAQPATRTQVQAAVAEVQKDPNLPQKQVEKTLRFKERKADQPAQQDASWLHDLVRWLGAAMQWLAGTARWVVWALGALAVALLLVSLRYWARARAEAGVAALPALPSHVQSLDIRPESLPEPIGASAAALWHQGDRRQALSLLYRGTLSRMVHQHGLPVRAASTEGECVQLAQRALDGPRAALVARLVQAWQFTVYGARLPQATLVLALCADFDAQFSAQARPEAPA